MPDLTTTTPLAAVTTAMVTNTASTMAGTDSLRIRPVRGFLQAELLANCQRHEQCWDCPNGDTCHYQILSERSTLFDQTQIPAVFLGATTHNLDVQCNTTPSIRRALAWIIKWGQTDPLPSRGLLLSGPTGAGKSFALAALLKTLTLDRGMTCLFVDFRHFLRQLKMCYDSTKQDSTIFESIRKVDILVLDDVGATPPTTWSRDIFETLISYRYNDLTRTFLTTNLSLELSPPHPVSPFAQWAGAHSFSRLCQMCYSLPFEGPDRRTIQPA